MNVLITGANRGIGLAFVKHYLEQGGEVWACYRRDHHELLALNHPRLHPLQWDVRQDPAPGFADAAGLPDAIDLLIINPAIKQVVLSCLIAAREIRAPLCEMAGISRARIDLRQWRHIPVPHH